MRNIHENDFCEKYCAHYNDKDHDDKKSACALCYDGSNFEDKEETVEQPDAKCDKQQNGSCKSCLFYL